MEIIRDDARVRRLSIGSKALGAAAMLILLSGLALTYTSTNPNVLLVQLGTLSIGWISSQVSIYLAHRYVRNPRPDMVLDNALKKLKDVRLYHYVGPVPHLLLTKNGPIVLNAKYQIGKISADGNKWHQRGVGLQRVFGQQSLGNPNKQAASLVGTLANYIRKNVPEIEDVPVGVVNVFTTIEPASLDVEKADIPSMHHKKLKGFLRQRIAQMDPLPKADYDALRAALDADAKFLDG